jgi:hypothetical protein
MWTSFWQNVIQHSSPYFKTRIENLDVLKNGFVRHHTVLNVNHLQEEEIYAEFIVVQFKL